MNLNQKEMEIPDKTRSISVSKQRMLTERIPLIVDGVEVTNSVEWFSDHRSDVLFNHIYDWRKLKIRKEELTKKAWQHFIQNLRRDYPGLHGKIKTRRAERGK